MRLVRMAKSADHQIGSSALTGRNEPGMAVFDIPTFGRTMSALVATTLDLTQKIMAKPNIVAAIAKLVFLRMGASDFRGRETLSGACLEREATSIRRHRL